MQVPDRLAHDSDQVDLVLGRLSRRSLHLSGQVDRLTDVAGYVGRCSSSTTQRSSSGFDGFSGGDGAF